MNCVNVTPSATAVITSVSEDKTSIDIMLFFDAVNGEVMLDSCKFAIIEPDFTGFETVEDISSGIVHKSNALFEGYEILSFDPELGYAEVNLPISIPNIFDDDTDAMYEYLQSKIGQCLIHFESGVVNDWGIEDTNLYSSIFVYKSIEDYEESQIATLSDENVKAQQSAVTALRYTQKVLQAAASLVQGIGNATSSPTSSAVGFINFAGSLCGLIADITDEFTTHSEVTMADLKAQLDSIEVEMSDVKSSISALSYQLSAMSKQMVYLTMEQNLNSELSSIDAYESIFDTYLSHLNESALECKEVNDTKIAFEYADAVYKNNGEKDLESLSGDEYKKIMEYYIDMIYSIENSQDNDRTSITNITKSLGALILGDSATSVENNSVISAYFDYVDSYYNWEPETFTAKANFLYRVVRTYLVGYCLSVAMCKYKGDKANQSYLATQMSNIYTAVFGSDDGSISGYIDKVSGNEKADPTNGIKIKCLVDGKTYDSDTFNSLWKTPYDFSGWSSVGDISPSFDANTDTTLSEGVFSEMFRRFAMYKDSFGYSTLKDELNAYGLGNATENSYSEESSGYRTYELESSYQSSLGHILSINSTGTKTGKSSVWHKNLFTGSIITLDQSTYAPSTITILTFYSKYKSSKCRWQRTTTIEGLYVGNGT